MRASAPPPSGCYASPSSAGLAPPRLALTGVSLFAPGALHATVAAAAGTAPEPDLVTIAEALASAGGRVEPSIVREWHRYDGDPRDLLELNRIVLDRQAARWEPRDHAGNRVEGRVVIDPSADVTDSIILGPCIIGAGARVANSYIGPYTSIGAGAEIEGAEIVRSIVAEAVRILHVSGRIEGSTIGRAGQYLPRLRPAASDAPARRRGRRGRAQLAS